MLDAFGKGASEDIRLAKQARPGTTISALHLISAVRRQADICVGSFVKWRRYCRSN